MKDRRTIDTARLRLIGADAEGTDASGHTYIFSFYGLLRQLGGGRIYLVGSIPESKSVEAHPAGAEGVGFNDPRACSDVGLMNLAYPLGLADAEFLETALQRDAILE